MGFFSGRAAWARYKIVGRSPSHFGPEHLEKLDAHAIGKQRGLSADGVQLGWIAGDHILDTDFELAKNIVNDTLHFALRVDSLKVPSDLLRAYTAVELLALAKDNPSGHPSGRQRREARLAAKDRLEKEAGDGRFTRRQSYPVLWDGLTKELLVGTTGQSAQERIVVLFQQTFGVKLEQLGAGRQAFLLAELTDATRAAQDAEPAAFHPGPVKPVYAWVPDESNRDYLGNEFLLWLWHVLDRESDTIKLSDDSEATLLLARNLVLECPRGQTGRESIQADAPARLPEARRAIQAGKVPRQAGITLVRHDHQYEFTFHAETLAVTGAKLPVPDQEEERARLEERVNLLRHLRETLDLLYDGFCRRRLGPAWPADLAKMQKWLQEDERTSRRAQPVLAVVGQDH